MKIKLAILDGDINYLNRIVSFFTNNYSEKLEIYSFTDAEVALASLKTSKADVLIASDTFDIDISLLPKSCGFAYFVESASVETYKDKPAINRYQKPKIIYNIVLEIYSEKIESIIIKDDPNSNVRIITFISVSGGVGSSSVAVACAKNMAINGKRVLYLNFEQFGSVESFFSGDGKTDFSDVIFALKSKKTNFNLSLKLENNVRQDASGVYFYASPKMALDIMEIKTEEIKRLITDLKLTSTYDYIIFDIDFSFDSNAMEIYRQSETIVFVSDGSEISNSKFIRAKKVIEILEQKKDVVLLSRAYMFYNKFSSKTGKMLDEEIRTIGGAPKYDQATTAQVIAQLVSLGDVRNIWDNSPQP